LQLAYISDMSFHTIKSMNTYNPFGLVTVNFRTGSGYSKIVL